MKPRKPSIICNSFEDLKTLLKTQSISLPNRRHSDVPIREIELTRSAAPSPAFEGGAEKRPSGSTLSKPWPSGQGAEGLTPDL